ncbi:Beta-lactamase-related protein [Macrophomina phaseolina MS6]|uniref:Beta-lactamase-related protein n=2 Tax=Macrophomina phaseolina TaxID=35725 RepID=K2QTR9_MACPH|nr:Beta-lactamase-related protein [Macrophomina phaseolina MS6]
MWIASCTKVMTSLAAVQCVERGQLALDAPVYDILPELRHLEILDGFDDEGKAILRKNHTPITLRLLLTHSSGIAYDDMYPPLRAWRKSLGQKPGGSTLEQRFSYPLVFEPGTQWMYGAGVDWAGRMVERVTNMTLEGYMKQHIWGPLGIKDMTFHLSSRPDLAARLTDLSGRRRPQAKAQYMRSPFLFKDVVDDLGGQGVYATAQELHKFVHGLLTCEDDERLLKRAALAQFFSPSLTESARASLNKVMKAPADERVVSAAGFAEETGIDWGLGGLVLTTDIPGSMHAGTQLWHGLPNLTWWVDRKAGLCAVYASQLYPPADGKVVELQELFAREMYSRSGARQQKL